MDNSKRPLNHGFVLNQSRYQGAQILLSRRNFGCGSSREHAPWALHDYGFRVIIAESFADIFYNNCLKNGILPVVLAEKETKAIFAQLYNTPGYRLSVDLPQQKIIRPDGHGVGFEIDQFRKNCLLNGWDEIALSLRHSEQIAAFELKLQQDAPWLFAKP